MQRNLATYFSLAIGVLGARLAAVVKGISDTAPRRNQDGDRILVMKSRGVRGKGGSNRQQKRAAQKRRNVLANRVAHRG